MRKIASMSTVMRMFVCAVAVAVLAGCASQRQTSTKYALTDFDAGKGVIVGTVFERSVFTPYGAYFYIQGPDGERIAVSSGAKTGYNISNQTKVPRGIGSTFALQLPPGRYQVVNWALDYGRELKRSGAAPQQAEFEVRAGEISYLGRFDANRFLELASIHDNYAEDAALLNRTPLLASRELTNRTLKVSGWWLPDPAGASIVKKNSAGRLDCEQC